MKPSLLPALIVPAVLAMLAIAAFGTAAMLRTERQERPAAVDVDGSQSTADGTGTSELLERAEHLVPEVDAMQDSITQQEQLELLELKATVVFHSVVRRCITQPPAVLEEDPGAAVLSPSVSEDAFFAHLRALEKDSPRVTKYLKERIAESQLYIEEEQAWNEKYPPTTGPNPD